MSYSNFKDPIGLLKRMIYSRNKVAYYVLWREFFSKMLVPLDYLLQPVERIIRKKSSTEHEKPVILLLGGSRSGTTLLYQTLAHYLPVSFIDNFTSAFQRSPLAAYKLFHNLIPQPKKNFRSYYGSVAGLGGPNDAFPLWNRWLGEDRNHIPEDIAPELKRDMKAFFRTWIHISKKPFLNKNNRNSLCAPMFDSVIDNVLFVEIYRDPVFVAQSLVLSRRNVQGSNEVGWGLLSKDSDNKADPLGYIDDICSQVQEVNRIIAEGRKKIDPEKYIRVSFEGFCNNPSETVKKLAKIAFKTKIEFKDLDDLEFSTAANSQRLNQEEFDRICSNFKKTEAEDNR